MKVWKVRTVVGHGWVRNLHEGSATFTAIDTAAMQFTGDQAARVVEALNRLDRVPVEAVEVDVDGPQHVIGMGRVFEFRAEDLVRPDATKPRPSWRAGQKGRGRAG